MKDLNDFNCAPPGVRNVIIEGDNGRVGRIPLPATMQAPQSPKRYSFLALSDAHINATAGSDADVDFIRAMQYANESDVAFTCICGDVLDGCTSWIYGRYAGSDSQVGLKPTYARKPVYEITGNHDVHSGNNDVSDESWSRFSEYLVKDPYYVVPYGDDVFIMLSEYGWKQNAPFADGELEWLQAKLEENRNKRCFVFFHVFNQDEGDSGQPMDGFYNHDIYALSARNAVQKQVFLSLLRHYKNTVWFHGHSHAEFALQSVNKTTVVSDACGYRSVHIPSLSKPKVLGSDGVGETDESGSQGYVVDVHEDGLVLRGRDFANGCFLPIATYRIDTPLVTVAAKSYTDATGTIAV
ncbi:MAG: metallophosphoesterase [Clostridia bacterium]|nr:metallophosphoesterase [Clostridia bacterium]